MNTKANRLYDELESRGFIYQSSDEKLWEIMEDQKMTVYVWTDPTADSLHVWHLVPLMMLSHFKRYGHNPLLLVWWATWMIGDPSFKNAERVLLTEEIINKNLAWISAQVNRILEFANDSTTKVVNNYDWFKDISILEFLRDTWKYFSVNTMLSKDSVKSRIEDPNKGISFTEFSYSLLQAYDFLYLNQKNWCNLQIWGSDQWGNIISWIDLVKKKTWATVYWITCPLITKSDWTKFWKSEWWNIWLDPTKTSPYKFYQFWLNVWDEEAFRFLKLYTFLWLDTIDEIIEESKKRPEKRMAQKALARVITTMIHGNDITSNVIDASSVLFWDNSTFSSDVIDVLENEIDLIELDTHNFNIEWLFEQLVNDKFFKSKSELRRLLDSNSLSIDWENIKEFDFNNISKEKFILKKWKKNHYIISLR